MNTKRLIVLPVIVAGVALLLAGCFGPTVQPQGEPRTAGEAWTDSTTGSAPGAGSCAIVEGEYTRPDPDCTPGAITTAISPADTSPTCLADNAATPEPAKDVALSVLRAYGIDEDAVDDYIVAYLVPRSLGGANDYSNLWPIAQNDPSHAQKVQIDAMVTDAVCANRAGIQAAQFVMSSDWTTALQNLKLAG